MSDSLSNEPFGSPVCGGSIQHDKKRSTLESKAKLFILYVYSHVGCPSSSKHRMALPSILALWAGRRETSWTRGIARKRDVNNSVLQQRACTVPMVCSKFGRGSSLIDRGVGEKSYGYMSPPSLWQLRAEKLSALPSMPTNMSARSSFHQLDEEVKGRAEELATASSLYTLSSPCVVRRRK